MGYDIHSPVKQVWLPVEYDFIEPLQGENFGVFANAYKKKYGIDLHDVFKLGITVVDDEPHYIIKFGYNQIGAYFVGDYELAISNAIYELGSQMQGETKLTLLSIMIEDKMSNVGYGFKISVPTTPAVINSIDDLIIDLLEN